MFFKIENSAGFLIECIDLIFGGSERVLSLLSFKVLHSSGVSSVKTKLMLLSQFLFSCTNGSTENIFVFLFREVNVIISMWMWVFSNIISIILPSVLRSQVSWVSEAPVFDV